MDDTKRGLRLSKGGLDWWPRGAKTKVKSKTWTQLANFLALRRNLTVHRGLHHRAPRRRLCRRTGRTQPLSTSALTRFPKGGSCLRSSGSVMCSSSANRKALEKISERSPQGSSKGRKMRSACLGVGHDAYEPVFRFDEHPRPSGGESGRCQRLPHTTSQG